MTSLSLKQPVSLWNRPLKADFRSLFSNLSKAAISASTADWKGAGKAILDSLTALRIEETVEERAWHLVYSALTNAAFTLAEEVVQGQMLAPATSDATSFDDVASALGDSLEREEVFIDRSLFVSPADWDFLRTFATAFANWLEKLGLDPSRAKTAEFRIRSYFVYQLHEVWASDPTRYDPIREYLDRDSPFAGANENAAAWQKYQAWLEKQVNAPVFHETFSLRQVYVPLRAFTVSRPDERPKKSIKYRLYETAADAHSTELPHRFEVVGDEADEVLQAHPDTGQSVREIKRNVLKKEPRKARVVVDLAGTLRDWVCNAESKDPIRVISGGPGSGKSSFATCFAATYIREFFNLGIHTLVIPLHNFNPKDDLARAVADYVASTGLLPYEPLTDGRRWLIIFDGLDELALQGQIGAEVAEQFVRTLVTETSIRNTVECQFQVILTGRELAIQANEAAFRKEGSVLHLVPYKIREIRRRRHSWDRDASEGYFLENEKSYHFFNAGQEYRWVADSMELLLSDQRDEWWRKYAVATGGKYDSLPSALSGDHLDEITMWPLLNYLVALSYDRGKIDFRARVSLNIIYFDLIASVYERAYAENRQPWAEGLSEEQFVRVLEEIALAAWHGDGRKTSVAEIERHCRAGGLLEMLESFREGATQGLTRLLTAFYFRRAGRRLGSSEQTFEFTHKSFAEYLCARRIFRLMNRILLETRRRQVDLDVGWGMREALVEWAQITGAAQFDAYLLRFLEREVSGMSAEDAFSLQETFARLFQSAVQNNMPMERLGLGAYGEMLRQCVNAGEAILVVHCACARYTRRVVTLDWGDASADCLGNWLYQIQGQRSEAKRLVLSCLQFLDMGKLNLSYHELAFADFSGSDLRGANLQFADLRHAVFRSANIEDVDLSNADARHGNFDNAELSRSRWFRANCRNATFNRADLTNTVLTESDLRGAEMDRCRLTGTDFRGADLRGLHLSNSKFEDAKFSGTRTSGRLRKRIREGSASVDKDS